MEAMKWIWHGFELGEEEKWEMEHTGLRVSYEEQQRVDVSRVEQNELNDETEARNGCDGQWNGLMTPEAESQTISYLWGWNNE